MNSTKVTTKKALVGSVTAKVAFVDEVKGLVRLFDGNTAGVIWRRRVHKRMQSWLDTLPVDQLPTGRIVLPVPKVRSAVTELMNISEMAECAERQLFLDDICLRAHEFNKLFAIRRRTCRRSGTPPCKAETVFLHCILCAVFHECLQPGFVVV